MPANHFLHRRYALAWLTLVDSPPVEGKPLHCLEIFMLSSAAAPHVDLRRRLPFLNSPWALSSATDVRLPKPTGLTITTEANQRPLMFWTRKSKEEHRYYLLPGMGRSNRRRHKQFLRWSIAVGLIASAAFAYLLYLLSQSH